MIVHALTHEMKCIQLRRIGGSPKMIGTVSAIVGKILVVRKSALPNARRLPEFRFKRGASADPELAKLAEA
jgi:hypothetical protein